MLVALCVLLPCDEELVAEGVEVLLNPAEVFGDPDFVASPPSVCVSKCDRLALRSASPNVPSQRPMVSQALLPMVTQTALGVAAMPQVTLVRSPSGMVRMIRSVRGSIFVTRPRPCCSRRRARRSS